VTHARKKKAEPDHREGELRKKVGARKIRYKRRVASGKRKSEGMGMGGGASGH